MASASEKRDTQNDLIIRTRPSFSFNNRWEFTEQDQLVDYNRVQDWHFTLLENNSHFQRIKICRLASKRLAKLLRSLSVHRESSQLEHLEIDRLELEPTQDPRAYYRLDALRSLSIDCVVIVGQDGKPIRSVRPDTKTSATFNAPNLRILNLGSNSNKYVRFSDTSNLTDLIIGPLANADQLAQFTSLERLTVDGVDRSNGDVIVQLAECGELRQLHCNLQRLNSTEFKPDQENDPNQLTFLERLYERLQAVNERTKTDHHAVLVEGKLINGERLELFFNHVQLDFSRPFADYHFTESLCDLHYRNIVEKSLSLVPCRTVTELSYLRLFNNFLQLVPGEMQEARTVFSILKFLRLYPCIRVVVLNNLGAKKGPNSKLFLDLLRDCCRALTELRILYSDFEGDFYVELARLKSVSQTLDRLTVMEACPSRRLVDFDALLTRLPRLHQLITNVASRETMIAVAGRMQYASMAEFTYWEGTDEADFYCCEIRKADGDDYCLIVRRICRDERPESIVYKNRLSLRSLAAYFNKPANAHLTAHWHDALKLPRMVVRSKQSTRSA